MSRRNAACGVVAAAMVACAGVPAHGGASGGACDATAAGPQFFSAPVQPVQSAQVAETAPHAAGGPVFLASGEHVPAEQLAMYEYAMAQLPESLRQDVMAGDAASLIVIGLCAYLVLRFIL